ncbi:hypothetical protein BpHYR1_038367 [Brachionus plicatilis]|uniref:Glycosyltransferase family 92 protein n=1 Tax=Brachionus plicatilis TaxID=10195 RepID=A0A3M7R194_BRAPC|nr:hypothetical protein BpHYR1_038367 [Brachionus plicatilis]
MNQLMVNECYLDNIDKYKYITVIDNDETIIPRADTLRAIQENLVSSNPASGELVNFSKCNSGKIDMINYLKSLKSKFDLKSPTSFYFKQGFYIKQRIADKIMKNLNNFLVHDLTKLNQTKFGFEILVKNSTVQTNDFQFDYKFKIESRFDYEYAKKLVLIYHTIIKPFLKKNGKILQKFSQHVDRLFMISGKVNNFAWGKSIHDTRRTFDMTVHHALEFFDRGKSVLYNDRFYLDEAHAKYYTLDYDYGHLSHFRSRIHFKFEPMPINYLHVDLNYFNCYFKPILRKLSANETERC